MPLDSNRPPHQHNEESSFDAMLEEAKRTGIGSKSDESPTASLSSDEQLTDNYQPEEEKDRSRSISVILRYYGESYGNKVAFQRRYRKILFWGCGVIIIVFAAAVLLVLRYALRNAGKLDISGVAAIITATLSLVVSILELVRIITKYCFPENDEEYIVKIVESIQSNDLEKYKETNRSAEARDRSSNTEQNR